MDSISRHTYGSDLIHNINVLSKNFDVLVKLSKYLELHKDEIFKDIDMAAMDAIIRDIDKGTYRGRRQIVVRPTEIIKDVSSGWKYKLISVEGETLGTFDVTEVTVEDFFYNLRDNIENTLPKELIVTNKDCNYNSTEILIVDRDKEFFSDLFEVYFYKADAFESFNWYNSTSSLAYVIFKLTELHKLIEQLEEFNVNVSEIIRLIEDGKELDGRLTADLEEYSRKIIELDLKGEGLVKDFSESVENTINTANVEIKELAEAANKSIDKTFKDNIKAIEELANSDFSSFATITYVEEQVDMINTDLSNYTTKEEHQDSVSKINEDIDKKADSTTLTSELAKKVNSTDFDIYKAAVNRQFADKQDKLTFAGTGNVVRQTELDKKWNIQSALGTGDLIRKSELDKKWDIQSATGSGDLVRKSITDSLSQSVTTAQSRADSAHSLATTANTTANVAIPNSKKTSSLGTSNDLVATQKLVNDVNDKAVNAQNTANTANNTANSALSKANAAAAGNGLGYGQKWQNVSGSRKTGTTYTNSTGKPIFVNIGVYKVSSDSNNAFVNNIPIAKADADNNISFIVPNGSTYKVTLGYHASYNIWSELR